MNNVDPIHEICEKYQARYNLMHQNIINLLNLIFSPQIATDLFNALSTSKNILIEFDKYMPGVIRPLNVDKMIPEMNAAIEKLRDNHDE